VGSPAVGDLPAGGHCVDHGRPASAISSRTAPNSV